MIIDEPAVSVKRMTDLTIEEALSLFSEVPAAKAHLRLMVETGMGYLQLGQPALTFRAVKRVARSSPQALPRRSQPARSRSPGLR